jgi:signal transduction histidine kinase
VVLQQQEIQSNMGLCLVELKMYDSALVHFDSSIAISEKYRDSLGPATMDKIYGVIYGNQGRVALEKNQLEKAELLSVKGIELNDREGYEEGFAQAVKLQLAEVLSRQRKYPQMYALLNDIKQKLSIAGPTARVEWERLMSLHYEETGQNDKALHYFKDYSRLRDSLEKTQTRLTQADVDNQLKKMEQELEITRLTKEKQMTVISLWVTVVFITMSIAIICLIYNNYKRSRKSLAISMALNEEINRQKTAREEEARQRHKLITEAVIKAQEQERSQIGLELHDNVNQVLTTVKLHNEMVMEGMGDAKQILKRTSGYLQECINEIRSLSKRLSAPTLGKISLKESVKDLIESINITSKVKIVTTMSGIDDRVLRQDVHLGIYRILQEQLNNVLKHSDASEVKVRLERKADSLMLSISDNGKGFELDGNKGGIGLMNMQTRAENLNGTFELESKPGGGCKVEVKVPCLGGDELTS